MFVTNDLIFLHLQKAAGTFVVNRLANAMPGDVRHGHVPLTEGKRGRLVVASIRDPWDWYVSLWAYGCMGQGELHARLVQPHAQMRAQTLRAVLRGRQRPGEALVRLRRDHCRDPQAWRALYTSAEDPVLFREWLSGLLTLPGAGHLPDSYPALPMCGEVGFMTYRVLKLFTDWSAWNSGAMGIRTPADALEFYRQHSIVDHVLRTERLEADLDRLLTTLSVAREVTGSANTNASRRRCSSHYYDAETIALVLEKDRMIVNAFGYAPLEPAA